jgi:hypothetical protein
MPVDSVGYLLFEVPNLPFGSIVIRHNNMDIHETS